MATETAHKLSIKILLSIDFDAVSGWLGTGSSPENTLSDYSSGLFAARVGVPRLLKLFSRLGISDQVTWFIPGHSAESFPEQTKAIIDSGAEIGLHGYCHEGAYQMTEEQERDVLMKSIDVMHGLTGKMPKGYRAPLYQVRESTLKLLEDNGILYDSSLAGHDSEPYFLPEGGGLPVAPPKFEPHVKAADWMHPLPKEHGGNGLVEIPLNWYMEDMTPMQFWPHTPNSQGYVDSRVIEHMWRERFEFIRTEAKEKGSDAVTIYPLVLHPDTSGMAHILPMVERFLRWIMEYGDEVEFLQYTVVAEAWKKDITRR
jgi:peptidoglycan/xylan/chitin deacetylase (PgdA/CDA1 family)